MTQWSDNRNHLLDDLLRAVIWVVVAQLVGIAPSKFVAVVALTQLSENFQHGNLRLSFGRIGERLWVSPRFHRLHHAIGLGHESLNSEGQTVLGGHNFGVLLPCWDVLFGTANFDSTFEATGIRDQVTEGRDYGKGFISQQILGIKRLLSALGLSSHT
jgi:sterol desaturase/sphingolipid hydroxylase (fatty acid hydroxylase superfamily)